MHVRAGMIGGVALLLAAPCDGQSLTLDPGQEHVVSALINGVALRLRVALDAHGFIILNKDAAKRSKLGRGDRGAVMSIGPVKLRGRSAERAVSIDGRSVVLPLSWYDARVDRGADGVISPALLPFERVVMRYGAPTSKSATQTFRMQLSDGDGLHYPASVGGAYSVAVRFAPDEPRSVAAGAAAAMMAQRHSGKIWESPDRAVIGFGVSRPTRRLEFGIPVKIGDYAVGHILMRTGDFLGDYPLPPGTDAGPDDEIVVRGVGERQGALYRMTLGADVLGKCSEAEYRRGERMLRLTCG